MRDHRARLPRRLPKCPFFEPRRSSPSAKVSWLTPLPACWHPGPRVAMCGTSVPAPVQIVRSNGLLVRPVALCDQNRPANRGPRLFAPHGSLAMIYAGRCLGGGPGLDRGTSGTGSAPRSGPLSARPEMRSSSAAAPASRRTQINHAIANGAAPVDWLRVKRPHAFVTERPAD